MVEALQVNGTLEHLNIIHIGEEAIKLILKSLRHSNTLELNEQLLTLQDVNTEREIRHGDWAKLLTIQFATSSYTALKM